MGQDSSASGHKEAVGRQHTPPWPRKGTEVPLSPSNAMRETLLSFSGAPKPRAKREGKQQIKSECS